MSLIAPAIRGLEEGGAVTLARAPEGYDAFVVADLTRALAKAGIKVPEECSVTGFDDVAVSALAAPSLTTIRQPLETMGATAVSIVMDSIKAGHENRDWAAVSQKLHPELVIRDSTRSN